MDYQSPLNWVVFTDLDGTLLELETYAYDQVQPAVELLKTHQIPLIFCSSKTRAEQEFYRHELKVEDPFIVENGSAIFIPEDYFKFSYPYQKSLPGYHIIELGRPVAEIRHSLAKRRTRLKLNFYGYGDLSIAEISQLTGLDEEGARRAAQRDYSETILESELSLDLLEWLQRDLHLEGLTGVIGSKFYTITGAGSDKGHAVLLLSVLFRRKFGRVVTVGLGDSSNDAPFLAVVDRPFLVQKSSHHWAELDLPRLEKVEGIGPVGWRNVIFDYLPLNNHPE